FRWSMDSQNSPGGVYFILLGLSQYPQAQNIFCLLLMCFIFTLFRNSLLLLLFCQDPQLHTPMYFFLSNLSFLNVCYTSSSMPEALVNSFMKLCVVECLLLVIMAYDCHMAISNPLCYSVHMEPWLCGLLARSSWTEAFLLTLVPVLTMLLGFCGHQVINLFSHELLVLLKLACSDLQLYESFMVGTSALTLLAPFAFIMASYGQILACCAVEGHGKAFSMCSLHLTVVALFYGPAISMYMLSQDKNTQDKDKIISMSYSILPMMNPLIYSLCNKEVKGTFRQLMGEK
uniref:G-protein coupled receptors family 1 profile domain-containing protein n=1 Tax=Otolemur garnettii TaxID=30611 RepID=H0XHD8_OTOGA